MDTVTATENEQAAAERVLRASSIEELLRKAFELTHKTHAPHGCERHRRSADTCELYAMRALIEAEIARRCER